jgi:hypothetical protein
MNNVQSHVAVGATISTDALPSYVGLHKFYMHGVIDHAKTYVDGIVHNQWHGELLESPEADHQGNLREHRTVPICSVTSTNKRFVSTSAAEATRARFWSSLRGIIGRRLTYNALTARSCRKRAEKRSLNSSAENPDVRADNPDGTMDRFTLGLRRVLAARKPSAATHFAPRCSPRFGTP